MARFHYATGIRICGCIFRLASWYFSRKTSISVPRLRYPQIHELPIHHPFILVILGSQIFSHGSQQVEDRICQDLDLGCWQLLLSCHSMAARCLGDLSCGYETVANGIALFLSLTQLRSDLRPAVLVDFAFDNTMS